MHRCIERFEKGEKVIVTVRYIFTFKNLDEKVLEKNFVLNA